MAEETNTQTQQNEGGQSAGRFFLFSVSFSAET